VSKLIGSTKYVVDCPLALGGGDASRPAHGAEPGAQVVTQSLLAS
jgi:hypothetical protein